MQMAYIGQLHVHGIGIHFGVNCYRANIEFLASADDADGNFPAVGYQNFFKHDVSGERF